LPTLSGNPRREILESKTRGVVVHAAICPLLNKPTRNTKRRELEGGTLGASWRWRVARAFPASPNPVSRPKKSSCGGFKENVGIRDQDIPLRIEAQERGLGEATSRGDS